MEGTNPTAKNTVRQAPKNRLDGTTRASGESGIEPALDLIRDGIAILEAGDSGARVARTNAAFDAVFGPFDIDSLAGLETDQTAFRALRQAIRSGHPCQVELNLYRADNTPFWCRASVKSLPGQGRWIALFEDASERKSIEIELKAKNVALKEALDNLQATQKAVIQQENLRALGQMASGIAHDFNNLLAPILGFSELLLRMPPESRAEDKLFSYLKKIQVAAQDGAAVVSRLREFYRSQKDPEALDDIDPCSLVEEVKEITRHRWKNQAEAVGATIEFQTERASSRFIRGNESELRQALANLIINAVDAIKGSGTIKVAVSDRGEKVRIQIKDSGCGMSPETLKKCSQPFYTTKGKLGTGLGLSIVCAMVQRLEGIFSVDSVEGKGTTITMDFPAHAAKAPEPVAQAAALPQASLKIMLVDDEEVLLEVISELLTNGGHRVDKFSDPRKAVASFEANDYDLVITDRAMPIMSGDQLAAKVKAAKPGTPVYMVTGFGDLIKDSGECPANIDEVLGKPVPLDVLHRKLAELCAGKN